MRPSSSSNGASVPPLKDQTREPMAITAE
ncbi:hypothetical protein A2U01_0081100, partial [Trifolium medium]|nr:hypothetical protein [Trifolium medium]